MEARRLRRGVLEIRAVPATAAALLRGLPELLASEDPSVQDWRSPRTFEDDEAEAEWRRVGEPELDHLFQSRQQTIAKDLASLSAGRRGTYRFRIPRQHEKAWLSGLNAARHILFITHALSPPEMDIDPTSIDDPERARVALQIHLLGWLQEILIDADDALDAAP